jgi:hypothetical protein
VILLENSNEWNLSRTKEGSSKKKEKEQGLKSKRGKTSFEKLHVSRKKKGMRSTSCWERFYRKRKKGDHIFPIVQNPMCGLIHAHTSFTFALPSIP